MSVIKKDRIGEIHTTNEGYDIEITEYFGWDNCTIEFIYNNKTFKNIRYGHVVSGTVKNVYNPRIYGFGYFGFGRYKSKMKDKSGNRCYNIWEKLIGRCYSEEIQLKNPSYLWCKVYKGWANFQVFAEWYESNYVEGFQLDKDILFKGNKLYSPDTCCFVPQEINTVFTKSNSKRGNLPIGVYIATNKGNYVAEVRINGKGLKLGVFPTPELAFQAYKEAKEQEIKRLADKWKPQITKAVYEAMYAYEVEIND